MERSGVTRRQLLGSSAVIGSGLWVGSAGAQGDVIRLGQTMPYSGPAAAYSTVGRVQQAYFRRMNEDGGVNGRRVNMISLDDGYDPARTVEQVRRLVEQEQVLALFQTVGTPPNDAIHKYVNARKVPHLFVASGASRWNDPKNFPWTFGFNLNYRTEGEIYARYLLKNNPRARIAILFQDDDYGRDMLAGVRQALRGPQQQMIVAEAPYDANVPDVGPQILALKNTGADTFINITTPRFAAQAIRAVHDSGWKPLHCLSSVGSSVAAVLAPAGLDKSEGVITAQFYKDANDPKWKDDAALLEWRTFMGKYYPEGHLADPSNVYGYIAAQAMEQVLKQAGKDLSRESIRREAANLKNFRPGLLLPGVAINTGPDNHVPVRQAQLAKFNGQQWELFGEVLGGAG